jgi:hypothetical protein
VTETELQIVARFMGDHGGGRHHGRHHGDHDRWNGDDSADDGDN